MPADAFPTLRFAAFALGGLIAGVGLVAWLGERSERSSPSEPSPSVRPVVERQPERDGGQTPAPPAPSPPPPPAPAYAGERVVTPGRVAYLRCDGVPQLPGAHPCARDAALETAVWAVVATLPRCDDPPPGLGQSDLRLELSPGTPTDVHARDVTGASGLDTHRLLACLAGPLSHVQSASRATRLVVSFRFSLDPH